MAIIKIFRELEVWKKAHSMVLRIYGVTGNFPKTELFGITSQIRLSAASVPTNIVEGFRRKSLKDSLNFYNIADTSLEETKYHLLLAFDLHYINEIQYNAEQSFLEEFGRLLTRWIQSQRQYL